MKSEWHEVVHKLHRTSHSSELARMPRRIERRYRETIKKLEITPTPAATTQSAARRLGKWLKGKLPRIKRAK